MLIRVIAAALMIVGLEAAVAQPAGVRDAPPRWETRQEQALKYGPAGREEFFDLKRNAEEGLAYQARWEAWLAAGEAPYWQDGSGNTPSWECVGPTGLYAGWGDSETSGRVSTIAIDPRNTKRVYIGASHGGVWKSVDGGKTWEPKADFEASLSFGSMALDPFEPDIIYAGTGEAHNAGDSYFGAGFLRSTDAGETWELLASDIFGGAYIAKIVASTSVRGLLFAATSRGLYRSLDGARTWTELLPGYFYDVVNSPRKPHVFYASGGGRRAGVYKSTDTGNTWELLDGPRQIGSYGRTQLAQCENYPDTVYLSTPVAEGNGIAIYRTDDGGRTWKHLAGAPNYGGGQLWYDNFLACAPDNPKIVYGAGLSCWRSVDGGETWTDIGRSYGGGNTHPDWHCYAFDPHDPKVLYAGSDGGMFVTYDRGNTWFAINRGLATLQFVGMDVDPWDPQVAYGGTQDNGSSRKRGQMMWLRVFGGDGGTTLVDPRSPNRVYTEYVRLAMFYSDDYGDSWRGCTRGIDRSGALFYAPFELDPNNPDVLIAGASAVYRTTDRAETWEAISGDMGSVSALAVAPGHSEVIYAGSRFGRLWVTPDTGKTWHEISDGVPRDYVGTFAVDPRNARRVFVGIGGFGHDHIFLSENAGGTWRSIQEGLPESPINHILIDPTRPDDVYVAMDAGVYVSNTGGGNWKRYGKGLPHTTVERLALNRRTGYLTAGTHGRSVWRIPLPDYKAVTSR